MGAAKRGQPPGTVVYTGVAVTRDVTIHVLDFDETGCQVQPVERAEDCVAFRDSPATTWLRVDGVHDVSLVQSLGEVFGLHPLAIEDIANVAQRPKLDDYGEYLFGVLRLARYDEATGRVLFEQVSLVLGATWVLSFQQGRLSAFETVLADVERGRGRIRGAGPDYLLYRLMDVMVDEYFVTLEQLGERVEELQGQIVASPEPALLRQVQDLKRDLIRLRRSVWPLREVVAALSRADQDCVATANRVYFSDLYDHTVQVIELTEGELELVSDLHDLYLNGISNRLNEVMKVLAVISTTMLPLNFLAGLYGMNFEAMPGLKAPFGFWAMITVMATASLSSLAFFRWRRWL